MLLYLIFFIPYFGDWWKICTVHILSSLAVLDINVHWCLTVSAPVVDLTDDDGKPSSPTMADSREVTFNKLSGKTFPSLVVVARPHLRIKDLAQGTVSQERAALGEFLMILCMKVTYRLLLRPALFLDFTQHRMVIPYQHFGTTYQAHIKGSSTSYFLDCLTLEGGTDRLFWHIIAELP